MARESLAHSVLAQDSLALARLPQNPLPESDYESICAAMMETAHGRWFLSEYAQRNRNADTKLVLTAIERIEAAMRGEKQAPPSDNIRAQLKTQLMAMADVIAQSKADMAALATGHETSDAANARAQKVTAVLRDLADQIHGMLDAWGDKQPAAEAAQETKKETSAEARLPSLTLVETPDAITQQAPEAAGAEPQAAAQFEAMFPDWLMPPEDEAALDQEPAFIPFEMEIAEPEPEIGFVSSTTEPEAAGQDPAPAVLQTSESVATGSVSNELQHTTNLDLSYEPSSEVHEPISEAAAPAAEFIATEFVAAETLAADALPQPVPMETADAIPAPEQVLAAIGFVEPLAADAAQPASDTAAAATFEDHLRIVFAKTVEEQPAVEGAILPPAATAAIAAPPAAAPPAIAPMETAAVLPPAPVPIAATRASLPRPEPVDPMAAILALSEEERIALCS